VSISATRISVFLVVPLFASVAFGQQEGGGTNSFVNWLNRADEIRSEQPQWLSPVATSSARLGEELHYDIDWLTSNSGTVEENYGSNKGLEFIPFQSVEVLLSPPPFIVHNTPGVVNGFGDFSFRVKYRLISRNEEHGDRLLTAFLSTSIPTGSYTNGAQAAVLTPTIAYGQGVGHLDAQGTLGLSLPTSHADTIGRTLGWNNVLQYQAFKIVWPEIEVNSSFFDGGKDGGLKQTFVTPGLLIGRPHLVKRVRLTVGGGFQIAATHFHSTNHNGIFTIRFPF
jgi:hypothetical protein